MTLCLRDIDATIDRETLETHFSRFGAIASISIEVVSVQPFPYHPPTRRDAHITFVDVRDAMDAHTITCRPPNRIGQAVQLMIIQ
jgi:hypothetical protein